MGVAWEAPLLALWVATVLPALWRLSKFVPTSLSPMQEDLEIVHVVFSSDADGFAGLLNSMLSVARHLEDASHCHIHLIVPSADLDRAEALQLCFEEELTGMVVPRVVLHAMRPVPFNISELRGMGGRPDLNTPATFARLYLPEYLPQAARALWLDIDTITQSDLAALYRMPMQHTIAAASESRFFLRLLRGATSFGFLDLVHRNLSLTSWFNPGVLLVDLRRWRADHVTQRLESLLADTKGWLNDMLLLNLAFCGDFDLLSGRWNLQCLASPIRFSDYPYTWRHAHIVHFTCGAEKPWKRSTPGPNDAIFHQYSPRNLCPALAPHGTESEHEGKKKG